MTGLFLPCEDWLSDVFVLNKNGEGDDRNEWKMLTFDLECVAFIFAVVIINIPNKQQSFPN